MVWRKIEVPGMMCLRNIWGIRRMDRGRNSLVRERSGCELSVLERIERNVLSGSGMWKEWGTNVEGNRGRERDRREDEG